LNDNKLFNADPASTRKIHARLYRDHVAHLQSVPRISVNPGRLVDFETYAVTGAMPESLGETRLHKLISGRSIDGRTQLARP
jgi:hypothetical protein